MIESVEIRNYKGFRSLNLKSLARVNVVTGPNAAGKTSLLEAIYIATRGLPDALLSVNLAREMPVPQPLIQGASAPGPFFRGIVDHFFHQWHDRDADGSSGPSAEYFSFKYQDSNKREYTLKVDYETGDAPVGVGPTAPPLRMRRKSPTLEDTITLGTNPQGQLYGNPASAPPLGPASYAFSGAAHFNDVDNAIWYSKLRETREIGSLVDFFRSKFPIIRNIEILSPNGIQGLYAEVQDGNIRRLSLISAGIHKLVSILMAITENKHGIVVVDEIENGIFHDKYSVVWEALTDYAKRASCQLFVSTH